MEFLGVQRMVIITEASIEAAVLRLLEDHGVKGYTMSRHIVGKGARGVRVPFGPLDSFGDNIKIEILLNSEEEAGNIAKEIIDGLFSRNYAGLIYLDDVRLAKSW